MNIGDYQIVEQIGVTPGGPVYLARVVPTGTTVLLKLPAHENAADGLRQEYALLQSLDVPEVLKPMALLEEGARSALVLEPFAGKGLDAVMAHSPPLSLPAVLTLALQVARGTAALHAAGIVHGDLRPANFLLAQADDRVQLKLADLSRATARDGDPFPCTAVGRDWAYVSPEQTGRMQRLPDYRTDFYSLGVLLYRLLTGELPYQADDPLEWVHCHLARTPVPPHERVAAVPPALSGLVLKLLAKLPEERYQSAGGLCADLEQCLAEWQACGTIAPFELGRRDVADRFQIPLKLYGREREAAALLAAFETVAATGAPTLVTVAGYSGVGKSALIQTLQQPVAARRGYFLAGKFDQYQRDIPYVTLAQAFDGLVRQLLGESDAGIEHWRRAIHEALEPNAQLMVSLIPRLELVIGPQPPVPDLSPQEAQTRFHLVFRRFLGVFARPEHLLVLFLDDLQWLDAGTLAVLADLATHPDLRYLLLVGAYRDNEVDDNHPLMRSLAAIHQAGHAVQSIVLASLTLSDVAQLVTESIHCSSVEAEPLAQLLVDKTGGNPFFIRQFLSSLAEEKLLHFDSRQGIWHWELPRIHAQGHTNNVVELMASKLARLPRAAQDALAQFACLGNAADAATLGIIFERSEEEVHTLLWESERSGLVGRQENRYTFLHDRVQEAAYSLIPKASQASVQLRVGRLLVSGLSSEAIAERIFEVVSQLNRGRELVESQVERDRIAELNLLAGQRAKAATAFASALSYLAAGAALLTEDCWERRHDLIYQLELNRAECEFLTGALAEAEERLAALATRAVTTVEQATVTGLRVDLYTTLDQSDRAIAAGLEYLRQLGIDWPLHPTEEDARYEYQRVWSQIGSREIEDLIDLPLMTDPTSLATLEVLSKMAAPAAFMNENMSSLIACRAVSFSIEQGAGPGSCPAYEWLAIVAGPRLGDYQAAYRFGRLGYELVVKRGMKRFEAMTYLLFGGLVIPWTRHIKTGRPILRQAFEMANRTGDLTYATYSCDLLDKNFLAVGDPLSEVQREVENGLAFAKTARFGLVIDTIAPQLALVRTLRGFTPRLGIFDDGEFDEHLIERRFATDPNLAMAECAYWVRKLQARFLAGDYETAIAAASRAGRLLWTVTAAFELGEYHFYGALSHAASCAAIGANQYTSHLDALAAYHGQLQTWAANCPETFENRAALVGAEIARLQGREFDAQRLYEQAIRSAHENGFVHNEAIAHERASAFYRAHGFEQTADLYLRNARSCYQRWEADGKVKQLEQQYPQLRASADLAAAAPSGGETQLDLLSVVKASQAISGQILLNELIDTLMRLVLENAGAQVVSLLLTDGDELLLAAEARVEQHAIQVRRHAEAAPLHVRLPLAVLQYVRRSREPVLLKDASELHPYSADPYFSQRQSKSVLCLPILRQSALIGVLYLENNLVTHAFTPDRVAVMELLASQAAISLENALAHEALQESEERLRLTLEATGIGTWDWDVEHDRWLASPTYYTMLGYEPKSGAGDRAEWVDRLHPDDRALFARKTREVMSGNFGNYAYEARVRHADGSYRWEHVQGIGIKRDQQGKATRMLGIRMDVTERKQAQEALLRHKDQLEDTVQQRTAELLLARDAADAASRSKSDFLANMSHEIRTPMNAILGMSYLALQTGLDAQQRNYIQKTHASAESLLCIINDILDFSKIEAGKLDIESIPFALGEALENVLNLLTMKAEEKGLELLLDMPEQTLTALVGDPSRLGQVLVNLGNNAVKFTDSGEVVVTVQVLEQDGASARLRFEVRDSGIGMSPEQQLRLFQPFMQADASTSRRYGGTGLGLAISRQLVNLMGGELAVDSAPGRGSCFHFELRFGLQPGAAEQPSAWSGEALRDIRTLVVDDNATARVVLAAMSRVVGLRADTAAGGEEALRCVEQADANDAPYQLLLLDWRMPGMDGVACVQALAERVTLRHPAPVVLMTTAFGREVMRLRLAEQKLQVGALLAKPVTPSTLLDACTTALGRAPLAAARDARRKEALLDHRAALGGNHILLVEDNAINQELAVDLLSRAGVAVKVACDGQQALDMLALERFDAVLMDCQMPVMDGFAATRALRQQPHLRALPVIAMTANAMVGDREAVLASGMNDHIAKPINIDEMFATLAKWLAPRKQTAPSTGAKAAAADFRSLPGVDAAAALERLGSNESLYERLLQCFLDAECDFVARFASTRRIGDMGAARRMAHDLQSVAGTLGMNGLRQSALALEQACCASDSPAIDAGLQQVSVQIEPILQGVQSWADARSLAASAHS